MNKFYIYISLLVIAAFSFSCDNGEKQILPPAEERVEGAKTELVSELIAPQNGWKLNYKPNPSAGTYFVLMDFAENGDVRIQSDLAADDGEYYDQIISYRVDVAMDIELILETYGFFHYLFEQNQSTFGGEFEFIYKGKEGQNLVFESKSDLGAKTELVFEPADPNDDNLLSRNLSESLNQFEGYSPAIFGQLPAFQKIKLENQNISIYWEFYPLLRFVSIRLVGEGGNIDEVVANDNFIQVFHESGFTLTDGKIKLLSPFTFNLTGTEITLDELTLSVFSMDGPPLCPSGTDGTPKYQGQIAGVGPITMETSLVSTSGFGFVSDNVFTVNAFFVIDSLGNSLLEEGSIGNLYPDASAFAFLYGAELINDSIPKYSTGIIDAVGDLHLRAYDSTETIGNRVDISLLNEYYFSNGFTAEKIQNIDAVTDEIYNGGVFYAYDYPVSGRVVYRLYNPCNFYEFALVQ